MDVLADQTWLEHPTFISARQQADLNGWSLFTAVRVRFASVTQADAFHSVRVYIQGPNASEFVAEVRLARCCGAWPAKTNLDVVFVRQLTTAELP